MSVSPVCSPWFRDRDINASRDLCEGDAVRPKTRRSLTSSLWLRNAGHEDACWDGGQGLLFPGDRDEARETT